MDLTTAVAILTQQGREAMNDISYVNSQILAINSLLDESSSTASLNPQIKAIIASIDVDMTALNSQIILLQQAIDEVARLVNQ